MNIYGSVHLHDPTLSPSPQKEKEERPVSHNHYNVLITSLIHIPVALEYSVNPKCIQDNKKGQM